MSPRPKNTAVLVSREYHPAPDACAQAISLLLTKTPGVTSTNGGDFTRRKVNTKGVSDVERQTD